MDCVQGVQVSCRVRVPHSLWGGMICSCISKKALLSLQYVASIGSGINIRALNRACSLTQALRLGAGGLLVLVVAVLAAIAGQPAVGGGGVVAAAGAGPLPAAGSKWC